MKKALVILFLCFASGAFSEVTLEVLRKEYHRASGDSAACAKLYSLIASDNPTSDNLIIGYKGAITAAMANHIRNKSEKLKLFNHGKKLMEQALKADEQNVELHFLRFTIQTNCPKALGYNEQIEADKKFILEHIDSMKSASLKKKMISFMTASKHLTEAEKKKLNPDNK